MSSNSMPTTVCITGPQWIGQNYFDKFYVPLMAAQQTTNPNTLWVIGDAEEGVDRMAQHWLAQHVPPERVTVFIKAGQKPIAPQYGFKVDATAPKYPERDALMAQSATAVIAVLPQFGGGVGGALVATLMVANSSTFETVKTVLATIRKNSEPENKELTRLVGQLYECVYAPSAEKTEHINKLIYALNDAKPQQNSQ